MADILYDAVLTPDQVTWAMRSVPNDPVLTLLNRVPTRTIQTDKVRWGTITRRNRMAKYRAFDGNIARTQRDSAADRYVSLAPFSDSLVAGEYETLQKQYTLMGGGNRAVLVNAILDDTRQLVSNMRNRQEMALGQTFTTGKFSVNENRTMFEADYGIPAANLITAAIKWDTNPDTALAGDDLRAMRDRYVLSAGVTPGTLYTTQKVVNALLRNAQIVAEAIGTQVGRTYLTRAELVAWLATNGIGTDIVEIDGSMYNDETGQDERVFPEGKLVMAPSSLDGVLEFVFGVSATAMELLSSNRSEMTFADAPGLVGMIVKAGPPYRQFTYIDAVGIPVLYGADRVVVGTVF